MKLPKIVQKAPYIIDEKIGKKAFCKCGLSSKDPYCDGSHKDTGFSPEIVELKETLKSRDYTRQHDYQFLIDENRKLEEERNELLMDNKRLAEQIDDQVNRLRKVGAL